MADSTHAGSSASGSAPSSDRAILDRVSQPAFAKDRDLTFIYCNPAFAEMLHTQPASVVGKMDYDLLSKELAERLRADDRRVMQEGIPESITMRWPQKGQEGVVRLFRVPLHGAGAVSGVLTVMWPTTVDNLDSEGARGPAEFARDRAEQARNRAEEIMTRQAQELLDLSTPVVEVWSGIVAVPLIGTLDSARTQQMTERLLEAIVQTRSRVALIDITGVPTVDTQTGRHLLETIAATRLLGAEIVLTGVRPVIAQTLVHLGIELSDVVTRPSLAAGLQIALDILGLQVTRKA